VHAIALDCVSELITFHQSSRSLRSTNNMLLTIPQTHLKLKGDQDFALAGPRLWKSLLHEIRNATFINTFKAGVKNDLGFSLSYSMLFCLFLYIACSCMRIVQHFGLQVQLYSTLKIKRMYE